MPRAVWKFEISRGPASVAPPIAMPVGAEVLDVGQQGVSLYLWALTPYQVGADPTETTTYENRRFAYFATGESVPDGWTYVGTVHVPHVKSATWGSAELWHVFEAA